MANLKKYGKRGGYLPRITNGACWPREDREEHVDMFSVEVSGDGVEYKAQFTEQEMLRITAEWLTQLSRYKQAVASRLAREQELEARAKS